MEENEKAYDFVVDGIYYKIIGDGCVAVTNETGKGFAKSYSGDVVIPTEVSYEGVDYQVTAIGDMAFWGCTGLTSVEIPDSVTKIGEGAIGFSTGLTSVVIPNSVTKIDKLAFSCCKDLASVKIPDSVTEIGEQVFSFCTGLTSVVIPDSVKEIGELAFWGCKGLTSVVIPNSVTKISDGAFYNYKKLNKVICKAVVPPEIDDYSFIEKEKLYVPKESVKAYREDKEWGQFKEILPIEE